MRILFFINLAYDLKLVLLFKLKDRHLSAKMLSVTAPMLYWTRRKKTRANVATGCKAYQTVPFTQVFIPIKSRFVVKMKIILTLRVIYM